MSRLTEICNATYERSLREDEEGLTILAYAFGMAAIVVPMSIAIFAFATGSVDEAQNVVNDAIGS